MPEAGHWRMFAHRYDNGDLHNLGTRRYVEMHGVAAPIVKVDVTEVSDDDPTATHWGWMRPDDMQPALIYPREVLFRVCFPYGVEAEVEASKGRIVRLAVTAMTETAYDTTDPAVCARLVKYITLEQEEIDEWRAVPAGSRWAKLAPGGIEACQALIVKYMALLADAECGGG